MMHGGRACAGPTSCVRVCVPTSAVTETPRNASTPSGKRYGSKSFASSSVGLVLARARGGGDAAAVSAVG